MHELGERWTPVHRELPSNRWADRQGKTEDARAAKEHGVLAHPAEDEYEEDLDDAGGLRRGRGRRFLAALGLPAPADLSR